MNSVYHLSNIKPGQILVTPENCLNPTLVGWEPTVCKHRSSYSADINCKQFLFFMCRPINTVIHPSIFLYSKWQFVEWTLSHMAQFFKLFELCQCQTFSFAALLNSVNPEKMIFAAFNTQHQTFFQCCLLFLLPHLILSMLNSLLLCFILSWVIYRRKYSYLLIRWFFHFIKPYFRG